MLDVGEVIERLKKYLNITTDAQLARVIGISAVTLSAWRYRNTIDIIKIHQICPDVNWNWLLNGEGEMRYEPKKNAEMRAQVEYLLRRVNELESQNKLLFKLLEQFVSREEIEKLDKEQEQQIVESNVARIDFNPKMVRVPKIKETPPEEIEKEKERVKE